MILRETLGEVHAQELTQHHDLFVGQAHGRILLEFGDALLERFDGLVGVTESPALTANALLAGLLVLTCVVFTLFVDDFNPDTARVLATLLFGEFSYARLALRLPALDVGRRRR